MKTEAEIRDKLERLRKNKPYYSKGLEVHIAMMNREIDALEWVLE
jgi:hypothetical protein